MERVIGYRSGRGNKIHTNTACVTGRTMIGSWTILLPEDMDKIDKCSRCCTEDRPFQKLDGTKANDEEVIAFLMMMEDSSELAKQPTLSDEEAKTIATAINNAITPEIVSSAVERIAGSRRAHLIETTFFAMHRNGIDEYTISNVLDCLFGYKTI